MKETDTSDIAATLFLLGTEAGNENYSVEARALATVVGMKMWQEAINRMWSMIDNEYQKK